MQLRQQADGQNNTLVFTVLSWVQNILMMQKPTPSCPCVMSCHVQSCAHHISRWWPHSMSLKKRTQPHNPTYILLTWLPATLMTIALQTHKQEHKIVALGVGCLLYCPTVLSIVYCVCMHTCTQRLHCSYRPTQLHKDYILLVYLLQTQNYVLWDCCVVIFLAFGLFLYISLSF